MLPPPKVETIGAFRVVRDDLLPGGTKMRALLPVMAASDRSEFVYASPAQGYAQVAMAHCAAQLGRKATIFTAKRATPHPLTLKARDAGAKIVPVHFGRLNVIQCRAREYATAQGAYLFPFGIDTPAAREEMTSAALQIEEQPREVWAAAGSGTLIRALQKAWPQAMFHAVIVGARDIDTGEAIRHYYPAKFEQDAGAAPFPSARNYDAKAWEMMQAMAAPGALFWNVAA